MKTQVIVLISILSFLVLTCIICFFASKEEDKEVGTREAAEFLGISSRAVRRLCRAGEVKAEKSNKSWQISLMSLKLYKKKSRFRICPYCGSREVEKKLITPIVVPDLSYYSWPDDYWPYWPTESYLCLKCRETF